MFKNDKLVSEIASYRIIALYKMAHKKTIEEKGSSKLSKKYIRIAKAISSHYKIKIPASIRSNICKKCDSVLVPGINCKIRVLSSGFLLYKCTCGAENHVPIKRSSSA